MTWKHDFVVQSNAIENYYQAGMEVPAQFGNWVAKEGVTTEDPLYADHMAALEYALEIAEAGEPLTESRVLNIHWRLCQQVMPPRHQAGQYRKVQITIGGHMGPMPQNVPWMMQKFLAAPLPLSIEDAFALHYAFETIHPFVDGNGRTGRVLLAYWAVMAGLPTKVFVVHNEDRMAYYDQITTWQNEHAEDFFGKPLVLL